MKIVYTKHAAEKLLILRREGYLITKTDLRKIIDNPRWKGTTRYSQETVISLMDEKHILRIILERKSDIIKVITFHMARRGRYESTL